MNKPIYVNTNSEGLGLRENPYNNPVPGERIPDMILREAHKELFEKTDITLPTYSQNNELIKGERVEVTEWYALSVIKDARPRLITDEEMSNYYSFEQFEKHKCMAYTFKVYRQVAIKEEKAIVDENTMTDLEIFIESWKPLGNHDYQQDKFMKDLENLIQDVKKQCSKVKFTCGDCHLVEDKIKSI